MVTNVRQAIERGAQKYADKNFLYCGDEEISFTRLQEITGKAANAFKSMGIKKGDKVALYLSNCVEFIYTWFGLAKLGAVMVPINTYFKSKETSYVISNSDSKIIVTDSKTLDMILGIRSECPTLEQVVSINMDNVENVLNFYTLIEAESEEVELVEIGRNDDAAILYTSGTTGNPKGCVVPQSYYLINPMIWVEHLELKPEDRFLTPLPLFHLNPQILSTMGALLIGASVIILDRFHPKSWWQDVIRYQATQFNYLGVMPAILHSLPESPQDRMHKARICMGAGISQKHHAAFEERFGLKAVEIFGMTESGVNLMTPIWGERKLGTGCMGKVVPGFRAKIVDDNDEEVPYGSVGELVLQEDVRLEGSAMMKEYYKNEEATSQAWRNGWFHTGDYAKQDHEGFFYFVDRKKDIIRRSGENISSMEVEDCVRSHPKVIDAAAVPVFDPIREQEVRICVILKEGENANTVPEEEIVSWCEERLAYYKVPRYVEYLTHFPKTASEKVQKSVLRNTLPERCYDRTVKGVVSLVEKTLPK